jgi:DNA invertase Pin-like site-specific DNA recombinase
VPAVRSWAARSPQAPTQRWAGFRSLADAWADTTTPHGKLMVTVLAGPAEFERSLILARTSEGRIGAKARGVKVGRKPRADTAPTPRGARAAQPGEALVEIAKTFGVSHSTISRLHEATSF